MEGQGVTFTVSCALEECAERICRAVVDGSVTGECIDRYRAGGPDGRSCLALVFEKHYYRAGNRLTLTVIIDNLQGPTRVHTISGGGGEGFFRFDWGASDSFENCAAEALAPYEI